MYTIHGRREIMQNNKIKLVKTFENNKCILCGNDTFEIVSEIDAKTKKRLIVGLCLKCGLIQQIPIPCEKELKKWYRDYYRLEYKKSYIPEPKHIYRAAKAAISRLKFLQKLGIKSGRLLDIGAGSGEFVYIANKLGYNAKGIEPNIGYAKYAKEEYNVDIKIATLEEIRETDKYDIITMFHVLEHLCNPLRVFKKLYFLAREEGIVFIEVPWIEAEDASPHNIYFKAHIFYFNAETLRACASQYFDVIKIDTSSNLKVVLKKKGQPSDLQLSSLEEVEELRKRIREKGWFEYLFKGRGILKPLKKIKSSIEENKVKHMSGKEIVKYILEINEVVIN